MLETFPFDPAESIRSREDAGCYMEAALSHGDVQSVVDALDVIARALGEPEPHLPDDASFVSIAAALKALGLRLATAQADAAVAAEAA